MHLAATVECHEAELSCYFLHWFYTHLYDSLKLYCICFCWYRNKRHLVLNFYFEQYFVSRSLIFFLSYIYSIRDINSQFRANYIVSFKYLQTSRNVAFPKLHSSTLIIKKVPFATFCKTLQPSYSLDSATDFNTKISIQIFVLSLDNTV